MSYIGIKIFIGMCVNIYASISIINYQSDWLHKRIIQDRKFIIEEIKKTAAK